MASSLLHEAVTTVNPALVQCECHICKSTVIARIKSIKLLTSGFLEFFCS